MRRQPSRRRSAARSSPAETSRRPFPEIRRAAQSGADPAGSSGASLGFVRTKDFTHRDFARSGHILRSHFHAALHHRAKLHFFIGSEENVAELLRPPGSVMNAADI